MCWWSTSGSICPVRCRLWRHSNMAVCWECTLGPSPVLVARHSATPGGSGRHPQHGRPCRFPAMSSLLLLPITPLPRWQTTVAPLGPLQALPKQSMVHQQAHLVVDSHSVLRPGEWFAAHRHRTCCSHCWRWATVMPPASTLMPPPSRCHWYPVQSQQTQLQ